ncbi:hypothetical protein [Streptomyces clavuligerus]|uniref:Uncharacterized protein n=1 Tax=Streptomyces clavuligerus TaxID=1901 RepID=D5SJ11_STRCL|nr:hypothetical protein [Streptomyces clavuligerus]EFG03904.1 Hypothetical protein SCLAV_p0414 [Streptomyces clavuligerus]MBY6307590.1 hypothetical protein [Streptomyces clavuligerus]QPJ98097.1 hypothetical protein GE265_34320 [Streptomyces clavuligerus]WDN56561.1 hypothetical protein LL058_32565 [Streptomyces clavuligerus]
MTWARGRAAAATEKERTRDFTFRNQDGIRLLSFSGDSSTPTVAVVDYLDLKNTPPRTLAVDRAAVMADVVTELHQLADCLNAAVVIVEQLTRAPLTGTPPGRLTDMKHEKPLLAHAETQI